MGNRKLLWTQDGLLHWSTGAHETFGPIWVKNFPVSWYRPFHSRTPCSLQVTAPPTPEYPAGIDELWPAPNLWRASPEWGFQAACFKEYAGPLAGMSGGRLTVEHDYETDKVKLLVVVDGTTKRSVEYTEPLDPVADLTFSFYYDGLTYSFEPGPVVPQDPF